MSSQTDDLTTLKCLTTLTPSIDLILLATIPAVVQADLIVRPSMRLIFWCNLGRMVHEAENGIRSVCAKATIQHKKRLTLVLL